MFFNLSHMHWNNVPMSFPMFSCISQMCSWILSNVPMLFPMFPCISQMCSWILSNIFVKCFLCCWTVPLLFRQGLNIHYNTFNTKNSLHLVDRWSWCIQEYTILRASPQGTLIMCQHQDKDEGPFHLPHCFFEPLKNELGPSENLPFTL
jgi:hypothetical protein